MFSRSRSTYFATANDSKSYFSQMIFSKSSCSLGTGKGILFICHFLQIWHVGFAIKVPPSKQSQTKSKNIGLGVHLVHSAWNSHETISWRPFLRPSCMVSLSLGSDSSSSCYIFTIKVKLLLLQPTSQPPADQLPASPPVSSRTHCIELLHWFDTCCQMLTLHLLPLLLAINKCPDSMLVCLDVRLLLFLASICFFVI